MRRLSVKTQVIIRLANILETLEKKHNFQCDEISVKMIMEIIHRSRLSNNEIVQEILNAHTYEQLKVEMGIDGKEAA